eukprot:CAMPEP_0172781450 /NCGR_PEP_ID=MMETSP1074-20121228/203434_1 /TAXON_ID=2916 /ORGANISM="Ceratium fusus, Strain PA161109" /LENGTH=793 /DNA_ID=CAMNT_0013618427 /DNA_START=26 /DNA_END=2403 /DNA_ORIENTATION=-
MASGSADLEFLGEIGRGSFSIVHKVQRRLDRRICACKEVSLSNFRTDKERSQALSEAQLMRKLSCPHIVGYLDAFIEQECLYIILQWCELGCLNSYLRRTVGALPESSLWRIFLRITFGLEYLHSCRIIHRDLKSQNVFLTGRGVVRIGDLGLAKVTSDPCGHAGTPFLCGTPRYLSPEEASGAVTHYTEKTDLWALGVVLYELCSDGHRGPFDEATTLPALVRSITTAQPPELPADRGSGVLPEICKSLLRKDPVYRLDLEELMAMPSVAEHAEKHGVLGERMDLQAARFPQEGWVCATKATDTEVPCPAVGWGGRVGQAWTPDVPKSHSITLHSTGSFAGHAEVPDGFCSRMWATLNHTGGESAFGPHFHRLSFCEICASEGSQEDGLFTFFRRRHHCRACGRTVCHAHSMRRRSLTCYGHPSPRRVCDLCSLGVARLLIVAAGQKAFAWDSRSPSAELCALGERLCWVGLASCSNSSSSSSSSSNHNSSSHDRHRSYGTSVRGAGKSEALCIMESQPGATLVLHALDNLNDALPCTDISKGRLMASCGPWFAAVRSCRGAAVVRVEELPNGRQLGNCQAEKITALAVQSGRGGFVATGTADGAVRIWRVPGSDSPCQLCSKLLGHKGAVTGLVSGNNGNFVCSSSKDCTVRAWRQRGGSALEFDPEPVFVCEEHRATGVSAVCCDGLLLALVQAPRRGSWEQRAALWDLGACCQRRSVYGRNHNVQCVALRGVVLATGSSHQAGCEVQLWHARTGTALYTIRNPMEISYLMLAEIGDDCGQNSFRQQQLP